MLQEFKTYYDSHLFEMNLILPLQPNFHHFRFRLLRRNKSPFVRVKDVIRNKEQLIQLIRKLLPVDVYFSPVKWLDPIHVAKSDELDIMVSSPLYFDIDFKGKDSLDQAKVHALKLIDFIETKYGLLPDWIVYSGKKGFHIYYWEWDNLPSTIEDPRRRFYVFIKSRKALTKELEKSKIKVDVQITSDPWRILRVPGTLHGTSGRIAKYLGSMEQLKKFEVDNIQK